MRIFWGSSSGSVFFFHSRFDTMRHTYHLAQLLRAQATRLQLVAVGDPSQQYLVKSLSLAWLYWSCDVSVGMCKPLTCDLAEVSHARSSGDLPPSPVSLSPREWLKDQCNEGHTVSGITGTPELFTVKGGDHKDKWGDCGMTDSPAPSRRRP